jgi:hypothetical protein
LEYLRPASFLFPASHDQYPGKFSEKEYSYLQEIPPSAMNF